MAWRHRAAVVMVLALAGLPVGGTVCALLCESAPAHETGHHGPGEDCEQSSESSSGPVVTGVSGHGCRTHTAPPRLPATRAAERGDLTSRSAVPVHAAAAAGLETLEEPYERFHRHATSGPPSPPTARPAVLRI